MKETTTEKYLDVMKKDPFEFVSAVREGKAFAVTVALSPAGMDGDEKQPVRLYSHFSRFVLKMVSNGNVIFANMNVSAFPVIKKRTEMCMEMEAKGNETSENTTSIAYTTKMKAGKQKGKTPAQYILEGGDPESKISDLKETYKWLNSNSDPKYAAMNKAQMDAITEAVNLYREGSLNSQGSENSQGSMEIYSVKYRPLVRKKQKNGKSFVYEYDISWTFGNKNPVRVRVKNYYAQVNKTESGTLEVRPGTAEEKLEYSMYLTAEEWVWTVYMMEAQMRSFEDSYGPKAYEVSKKHAYRREENE